MNEENGMSWATKIGRIWRSHQPLGLEKHWHSRIRPPKTVHWDPNMRAWHDLALHSLGLSSNMVSPPQKNGCFLNFEHLNFPNFFPNCFPSCPWGLTWIYLSVLAVLTLAFASRQSSESNWRDCCCAAKIGDERGQTFRLRNQECLI